nr:hypothetical protein [Deltaproteobacteria bacterium]
MITRATILMLVLCGCSSTPRPVTIPEPGRVVWEQCHTDLVQWCRQRSHGDAQQTATCEQDRANEFAGLITDQARREYLGTHGCPI